MSDRELIHQYLKNLSKYLSRLSKSESEEVIREIESHIFDAIELQENSGQRTDAQEILDGFGQPRTLANQYVEHLLQGTPPPTGFKAIQSVKKGATKTLYYSMAALGLGVAFILITIGLGKLFFPNEIGVWSASQGNSVIISFSENMYPKSTELLGYWLSPIAVALGAGLAYFTKSVLRVLKQSIQ
ncbi:MAG: hypothetical protein ABJK37_05220 [Paraglaciecola sp.]|uniref:HAAS signaling domain-containing protein n=1 Tax=Paraglaciecola sp. TaxID=1920173 RepID=UPI003296DC62